MIEDEVLFVVFWFLLTIMQHPFPASATLRLNSVTDSSPQHHGFVFHFVERKFSGKLEGD